MPLKRPLYFEKVNSFETRTDRGLKMEIIPLSIDGAIFKKIEAE